MMQDNKPFLNLIFITMWVATVKCMVPRCSAFVKKILQQVTALWRYIALHGLLGMNTLEPYYDTGRSNLYNVHGKHGIDPTEPTGNNAAIPAKEPLPYEPLIQDLGNED